MKANFFRTFSKTLILLFALTSGYTHAEWQMLYQHDKNGKPIAGDKTQLLSAIRSGASIRIGWGVQRENGTSVEHTAVPDFITISEGSEVFVQVPEHIFQTSYWNSEFQDFNNPQEIWKGLFSTTGRFMAVWYNRATGTTVRRMPQRVPISWFADMSDEAAKKTAPLYLSEAVGK